MPAQSPTLSPTLSAMVAALRGSSSGMCCSILPTRSAPTSAALVKIPPPTRMNIASSAAPNPKPSSTCGALSLKISTTMLAPSRPRPTVSIPTIAPVRKPIFIAGSRPTSFAAAATRRFELHGQGHAEVADRGREPRAHQEEHRPAEAHTPVVGREGEQRHERHRREHPEGAELSGQVGAGTLLHALGDVLHVLGAFAGSQDLVAEQRRHAERAERDHGDDDDQHEVGAAELHGSGMSPVMILLGVIRLTQTAPESTQVSRPGQDPGVSQITPGRPRRASAAAAPPPPSRGW